MAETLKAHKRRFSSGWFEKYCQGVGIDIGVGRIDSLEADPILPTVMGWDQDDGDATFMYGVADNSFDFVYSSHCIEHISNPYLAVKNWWRILKPGGHLIIYAPHRDLYEKRKLLPSRWNHDHKFFLLPVNDELPHTLGLLSLVQGALSNQNFEVMELNTCDEGWIDVGEDTHSVGEFSIELIVKKNSS